MEGGKQSFRRNPGVQPNELCISQETKEEKTTEDDGWLALVRKKGRTQQM